MSKITATIITRDAPAVIAAIRSIAPHVDEVLVVDTGSTPEHLARLRAEEPVPGRPIRVEVFTGCNDVMGRMADFGAARQHALSMVQTPWFVWLDSDDVVRGGQHIRGLAEHYDRAVPPENHVAALFPYEYSYHADGKVGCLHYRERLMRTAGFRWTDPVHEVCMPIEPEKTLQEPREEAVWEHRRADGGMPSDPGRNLRIMRSWVASTPTPSARQLYYLGQELMDTGMARINGAAGNERELREGTDQLVEAETIFTRYIGISGWDDERVMAGLRLVTLCLNRGDYDAAEGWGGKLIQVQDAWAECWLALGRVYYLRAEHGKSLDRIRDYQRCVRHLQRGLQLPQTRTVLFIDPRERAVVVYELLNKSLNELGDVAGAAAACVAGLQAEPGNPNLQYNHRIYRAHLVKQEIARLAAEAATDGALEPAVADGVKAALEGQGSVAGWPAYRVPNGYPANAQESDRATAVVTPHPQAWGIPESFDFDGLPLRMTDGQLRSLVLAMWHEFAIQDEVMSAQLFLANAPYRVRHDPAIMHALKTSKAWSDWIASDAEAQKVNQPADPTVETGTPLPAAFGGAAGVRLQLALDALGQDPLRVLDLGCFDGGFTNRMGIMGHKIVGVDLCESSVELANRKAAEFNTGAVHVVSRFEVLMDPWERPGFTPETIDPEMEPLHGEFDAVTCTDTWEHVIETQTIVRIAKRKLKPGGKLVLVTPHGAWMRGVIIPWAHPWRYGAEDRTTWVHARPRAHLIAPTPMSVADSFDMDTWDIENCFVIDSPCPDLPGQGWVVLTAHLRPTPKEQLRVAIACGQCWERWTPHTRELRGIGGSESAVVEMAKRMAAKGAHVTVFGDCGREGEGIYDGVVYVHHDRMGRMYSGPEFDVLVAWRDAALLEALPAKRRLLWVHDIWAYNLTNARALLADGVLGLSEWHVEFLRNHHRLVVDPAKVQATRNGIDISRFTGEGPERDPHRCVYSSSPDRGLPMLLHCWPKIRMAVPTATLHVYYGFDGWKRTQPAEAAACEQLAITMQSIGVHLHGRVDQDTLAREFRASGSWMLPTWFEETSCCHPDTRVSVPGDHRGGPPTVRIADLVGKSGFPVYAFNEVEHRFQIATCNRVWQTKVAEEMVAIRLDDGQLLRLTPEHLVLTFDGDWVEAGMLKAGESLRALHYRYNVAIRDASGRWTSEHRLVGEWMHGGPLGGLHVDHSDLQRLDNRPESLRIMTAREHGSKTHAGSRRSKLAYAKSSESFKRWLGSAEGMAHAKASGKRLGEALWAKIDAMTPDERASWKAARVAKSMATKIARKAVDPEYADRLRSTSVANLEKAHAAQAAFAGSHPAEYAQQRKRISKAMNDARWGKNHKVVSVERIQGGPVFDMEVEGLHNFVADGVVVHNCIGAMEAQAAGLHVVTTALAALNETVFSGALIAKGDYGPAYAEAFTSEVISILRNFPSRRWTMIAGEPVELTREEIALEAIKRFDWDPVAVDWLDLMRALLEAPRSEHLAAYVPAVQP